MTQENKSFLKGILFALVVGLGVTLLALLPQPNSLVLVIGNPLNEQSSLAAVTHSGGQIVSEIPGSNVVIAKSEADDNPTFTEDLYRNGALLVLDAQAFIACFYPDLAVISATKRTA